MAKLVIVWSKAAERAEEFEAEFLTEHAPLAALLPGGTFFSGRVVAGAAARVSIVTFESMSDLKAALRSEVGTACTENARALRQRYDVDAMVLMVEDDVATAEVDGG